MTSPSLRSQIVNHAPLTRRKVFSIFCIGTGHNQQEANNTIAALGHACVGPDPDKLGRYAYKYINDGPGSNMKDTKVARGLLGLVGWGMNNFLDYTYQSILQAAPTVVNMTGHSRGAILCHMIAHKIYAEPATRHIKINMIVLDPVHQSKIKHEGAEGLDDNPNLLSYHAFIMENEVAGRGLNFPFKFVEAPDRIAQRMHYINMPGSHGSGSQQLTSPVGMVVYQMIANFMRARGTEFSHAIPTPLDMCEYFALIHAQNPLVKNGKNEERILFDDHGHATVHNKKKEEAKGTQFRKDAVINAFKLNQKTVQQPHLRVLPGRPIGMQYFFNAEHAFYFKMAFPYMYSVLSKAPTKSLIDPIQFAKERQIMQGKPGLNASKGLLLEQISELWLDH